MVSLGWNDLFVLLSTDAEKVADFCVKAHRIEDF